MAPASMSSDEEVKWMDIIGWYFQLRTHTWKLIRFFLDSELQVLQQLRSFTTLSSH